MIVKKSSKEIVCRSNRMEITCGEAPYLVSRYDTVTGRPVPVGSRVGMLDRKLRVIGERINTEEDWFQWDLEALKSAKGYLRRSLGRRMIIRSAPELIFLDDRNIEYGVHIAKVLAEGTVRPGDGVSVVE